MLTVEQDRVAVDASNVPLGDVLAALSREVGVSVRSADALAERVTLRFPATSFDDAVSRLLKDRGFSIRFGDAGRRPIAIYVFGRRAPVDADRVHLQLGLTDADPVTRVGAVLGLATTADTGAEAISVSLQGVLDDPDPAVRDFAIVALSELPGGAGNRVLERLLRDDDPQSREDVVHALAELEDVDSLRLLRTVADDLDADVRVSAGAAIAERRLLADPR
ncbi:MAG: HEAT repeat domain-containing protein [Pseudomonadales bacterium]